MSETHLSEPMKDVVMLPLKHDTPDEMAQPQIVDWNTGEVEPIPGKTMPHFKIVERDYTSIYEKFISLGKGVEKNGIAAHGLRIPVADEYDYLKRVQPREYGKHGGDVDQEGDTYPSLEFGIQVCDTILRLDPASNGELAHRAFEAEEKKTGLSLTHLAANNRDTRISFSDLISQPRRVLTTPTW